MEQYKEQGLGFRVWGAGLIVWMILSFSAFAQSTDSKVYRLTLEEATQLALDNNFDIQIAKYDAWIKQTDGPKSESIYDLLFRGQVGYQDNQRKQTSTILGTQVVDNDYNIGLTQKLPTGTTLEVDLNNNRNSTNSSFATSPLTHDSTLAYSVLQDLGKNFFGIQDRGQIKITYLDIANSKYTSLEKIEESIAQAQNAYWDLVLENQKVDIAKGMLDQAKRLYDLHQEQVEDGAVERADVLASEANYRKRQNELELAGNRASQKNNALKLLLNISDDTITIEPADKFAFVDQKDALNEALSRAIEHRRDYKKALNNAKSKDISLSMKKNNLWPEINLAATLEQNGLGDHFKHAVTNITEENNPNLIVGLTFEFPFANREAKSELKAAEYEKAKVLVQLKLIERTIAVEIMDQYRNYKVFKGVAQSNEQIAILQAQKLEEEIKRFDHGRSDTDTLVRFQEDLIQAEEEAAESKHQYKTALIELKKREGVLLDQYWKGEQWSN